MAAKPIRIGTRDSKLALFQAHWVKQLLQENNWPCEIVAIKSEGDLILTSPLNTLGTVGVFTKTIDAKLQSGEIDIAVHSLKDLPTIAPEGLVMAGVLERHNPSDVFVYNKSFDKFDEVETIATGSIRRKAQWLRRFSTHQVVNLRGNMQMRLQKIQELGIAGGILAMAGLERIDLLPQNYVTLDWMIPAPAQGIIGINTRKDDVNTTQKIRQISHQTSFIVASIERNFLRILEGGCTAPIGALATIIDSQNIHFKGILLSEDGSKSVEINQNFEASNWEFIGQQAAEDVLKRGGEAIISELKSGK